MPFKAEYSLPLTSLQPCKTKNALSETEIFLRQLWSGSLHFSEFALS